MISLRPYQVTALNNIDQALRENDNVLLSAIMGAGKTVMVCRLINKYKDKRFLILAHKQELVSQFHKSFLKFTDINPSEIGIICAALNQYDISKRITIGTIQTYVNHVDNYSGCDLMVIDECHKIDINYDSQYSCIIDAKKHKKLLGVTATPYRLGAGYIYGDANVGDVLFDRVHHKITYNELMEQGYLSKLKGRVAYHPSLSADLGMVNVSGDYILDQLGDVMTREIHLFTGVAAIQANCEPYKHICVFCTTIEHAEKLRSILGDEATTTHSQLTAIERHTNLKRWMSGEKRIITSVNILTEGFDFPELDCLVFARPTLSPGLFLQAVGRVVRIHPGKDHGFLLDLTDNTSRFGTDLDNVKVAIPRRVEKQMEGENQKLCPGCEKVIARVLRVCPHCGFEWTYDEMIAANHVPELADVEFKPIEPEWYTVKDMKVGVHTAKSSGKQLGFVRLYYGDNYFSKDSATIWLCLPDYYDGYAVTKAMHWWDEIGMGDFPESVDGISEENIIKPDKVLIDLSGKYPEIKKVELDDIPF